MIIWNELAKELQSALLTFKDCPRREVVYSPNFDDFDRLFVEGLLEQRYDRSSGEMFYILSQMGRVILAQAETPHPQPSTAKQIFPTGFEDDEERVLYERPQPATAPTAGGAGDVVGQTIYDAEAVISGYHFTFGNGEKHRELNLELKGFPPMVTQGETVTVVITRKQDATPQQADLATLRAENAKLVSELAAVVSACNHKAKVIDAILDRAQELDIPVYRSLRIVIQDLDDGYVQP